ncbi:MAG: pyridoxamine 5'-phosphate oxidase [Actinomycetota bacterium]
MSARWIPFDVSLALTDPFAQFAQWFEEASRELREPEAVSVITSDASGQPSARMVLLRERTDSSFGWFTNYDSRKGHDLVENPQAGILWYVEPLGRQVRIEGVVARMSPEESDAYFASRPRGHQIGAHASGQSEVISSRAALERRVRDVEERYEGGTVPRPAHWGGFRLTPRYFEFWQHREDRLHDRVIYRPEGEGGWLLERLMP